MKSLSVSKALYSFPEGSQRSSISLVVVESLVGVEFSKVYEEKFRNHLSQQFLSHGIPVSCVSLHRVYTFEVSYSVTVTALIRTASYEGIGSYVLLVYSNGSGKAVSLSEIGKCLRERLFAEALG